MAALQRQLEDLEAMPQAIAGQTHHPGQQTAPAGDEDPRSPDLGGQGDDDGGGGEDPLVIEDAAMSDGGN
jgi:hypothetical protein